MDVLVRFGAGAIGLVLVTTVAFAVIGGSDEPADAVAAPSPTPSVQTPVATGAPTASEIPSSVPSQSPVSAEPTEPATPAEGIDPASISLQVLDGVLDDGAATATNVSDRLRDGGYDVVAQNRARRPYDVTTVFYTADNEAQARQIAAVLGATVVDQAPGNLSDSVQVHIVVGADFSEQ